MTSHLEISNGNTKNLSGEQLNINTFLESINESCRNLKEKDNLIEHSIGNPNTLDVNNRFTRTKVPEIICLGEHDNARNRIRSRSLAITSKSNDNDDHFIDNVLNNQERRTSWTRLRSQRTSYAPSLTAFCK